MANTSNTDDRQSGGRPHDVDPAEAEPLRERGGQERESDLVRPMDDPTRGRQGDKLEDEWPHGKRHDS